MIRYTAYAISLAANRAGIFYQQANDLLTELRKMKQYSTDDLQKLEDIYEKAVSRGDEDIADHTLQLTTELQEKIVKENQ